MNVICLWFVWRSNVFSASLLYRVACYATSSNHRVEFHIRLCSEIIGNHSVEFLYLLLVLYVRHHLQDVPLRLVESGSFHKWYFYRLCLYNGANVSVFVEICKSCLNFWFPKEALSASEIGSFEMRKSLFRVPFKPISSSKRAYFAMRNHCLWKMRIYQRLIKQWTDIKLFAYKQIIIWDKHATAIPM